MNTPASLIHSTAREVSLPYRATRPSTNSGDTLVTNFFPAEFSTDSVIVWAGRWTSREEIEALEAAHAGLATWRDPDDASRVYAWDADCPNAIPPIGFRAVTVSHSESPRLFQRLMLDAVHTRLAELGFAEKDGGGFVNYDSKNFLGEIPALSGVAGDTIGIYAKIIVEGFFTKPQRMLLSQESSSTCFIRHAWM